MSVILLLSALVMATSATSLPVDSEAKILSYKYTNDGKGNYFYRFETSNFIKRKEKGTLVNEGQPDEHVEVTGFYSYFKPGGGVEKIYYTADEHGYKIISSPPMFEDISLSIPPAVTASLLGK